MASVRIVLAVNENLSDDLRHRLERFRGLEMANYLQSSWQLVEVLRTKLSKAADEPADPLVVLTSVFEHDNAGPMCTRLIEEFPEVVLYDVRQQSATRYCRMIQIDRLTIDELFAELNSYSQSVVQLTQVVP